VDLISAWLKGIILIILFATFMDLLLPSSSMQKYVKLVIGLIIIVTMLTPLLVILYGSDAVSVMDFLDWERGDAIVADAIAGVNQSMSVNFQDMTIEAVKQMTEQGLKDIVEFHGEYELVDLGLEVNGDIASNDIKITKLDVYVRKLIEQQVLASDNLNGDNINVIDNIDEVKLVEIGLISFDNNTNGDVSSNNEGLHTSSSLADIESANELKQIISKELQLSTKAISINIVEES